MYSLRIKTPTAPTTGQVDAFKAYIGQSGSAADAILAAILLQAMIHVGEYADRGLVAATYELVITERDNNFPVRLYCTPATVLSVTDGEGNNVAFRHASGTRYVEIDQKTETLTITYTTQVDGGAAADLLPKVWEYGKARYEGRDSDAAAVLTR